MIARMAGTVVFSLDAKGPRDLAEGPRPLVGENDDAWTVSVSMSSRTVVPIPSPKSRFLLPKTTGISPRVKLPVGDEEHPIGVTLGSIGERLY